MICKLNLDILFSVKPSQQFPESSHVISAFREPPFLHHWNYFWKFLLQQRRRLRGVARTAAKDL
jgi:hypothetical protein